VNLKMLDGVQVENNWRSEAYKFRSDSKEALRALDQSEDSNSNGDGRVREWSGDSSDSDTDNPSDS